MPYLIIIVQTPVNPYLQSLIRKMFQLLVFVRLPLDLLSLIWFSQNDRVSTVGIQITHLLNWVQMDIGSKHLKSQHCVDHQKSNRLQYHSHAFQQSLFSLRQLHDEYGDIVRFFGPAYQLCSVRKGG